MSEISSILNQALGDGRTVLTEFESKRILASIGIPIPKQVLFTALDNPQSFVENCAAVGYPVVLKLISEEIVHKTDMGAVKLNIKNDTEAKQALQELVAIPTKASKAISIQEMAKKPIAEIIVGSLKDPQFGPTVMFIS